jgi:hypothetical protein
VEVEVWILAIGLGAICGLIGQALRVLVGLHKVSNQEPKPEFDPIRLVMSLLMGIVAGSLAAVATVLKPIVSPEQVMALIAAGYAGADFIEGFVGKYLPKGPLK